MKRSTYQLICAVFHEAVAPFQQLAKKVNNVETSWALGATFDYFRNLDIH